MMLHVNHTSVKKVIFSTIFLDSWGRNGGTDTENGHVDPEVGREGWDELRE